MRPIALFAAIGLAVLLLCPILGACGAQPFENHRPSDDIDDPVVPPSEDANSYGIHAFGWKSLPIDLHLDERFSDRQIRAIQASAQRWNEVVGRVILNVLPGRFHAENALLYDLLDDNINTVVFESDWCKTGKPKVVLATTIWDNQPDDWQKIVTSDIAINTQFYVADDASEAQGDGVREVVDLETLMLHELGHLLGLAHISTQTDAASIMLPQFLIGEGVMNRHLSPDDVARVRYLYVPESPLPTRQVPPSSGASPSKDPESSHKPMPSLCG